MLLSSSMQILGLIHRKEHPHPMEPSRSSKQEKSRSDHATPSYVVFNLYELEELYVLGYNTV
jgi:hypothetical protein